MGCFIFIRMKKILYAFLALVVTTCRLYAIPARPIPVIVVQSDGTSLDVYLRGDERCHFKTTADNMPIVQGNNGNYYYAIKKGENLECSKFLAHNKNERSNEEKEFINLNQEILIAHIEAQRRLDLSQDSNWGKARRGNSTRSVGQPTTYRGKKKGLVILVNF